MYVFMNELQLIVMVLALDTLFKLLFMHGLVEDIIYYLQVLYYKLRGKWSEIEKIIQEI